MPTRVGPYLIAERIGAGGMGVVYRARDERLDRWVAIKHVRPEEADARSRERLRREARAVASLSHPAIVQVHDILEEEDGDWIVMEWIGGRTLQETINEEGLEIAQVVQLGREVAEGLGEAHAKGVIHRDLKTENVMVTESGHAKILDFGLAKRLWKGRAEGSLSIQGAILGTGRAMSPEQVLGEEIDHRSDLFSLGTLLYETLTGRRPFSGSSLIITLAQVCTEEQARIRDLVPEVPGELSDLVDRLLAKDPLQRPQSAGEVVEALGLIAARLSTRVLGDADPSDTAVLPIVPFRPALNDSAGLRTARPNPTARGPTARGPTAHGPTARGPTWRRFSDSASTGIFIKTLVHVGLVHGGRLDDPHGDARAYEILARHEHLLEEILRDWEAVQISQGDELLFLFERPADAVAFALSYFERLDDFAAENGVELDARAGVHLSEVFLRESQEQEDGTQSVELEGDARLIAGRLAEIAGAGRIFLSQETQELARRAMAGHPLQERKLHWARHGSYFLAGAEETVRVHEVSPKPIAPGSAPAETANARRVIESDSPAPFVFPRRIRTWVIAALALVLLTTAGIFLYRDDTPPPIAGNALQGESVAPLPSRRGIAVLGFRNLSQKAGDDWLSTAFSELLSAELAGTRHLRVIDGETVARMRMEDDLWKNGGPESDSLAADTLDRIGWRLGSDFVILGSYFKVDGQLTLQAKLQDTKTGETLASTRQSGPESQLAELISALSVEVRQHLGLGAEKGPRTIETALSSNDAARKFYYEGLGHMRSFDILGAQDLLLKATEADPDFAIAHAALSHARLLLGLDQQARDSANQAFLLASSLSLADRLWIKGGYHEASGDWERAIAAHQELWRSYPEHMEYGLRLAEVQINAGYGRDSLKTIAELRRLPAPVRDDPRIDVIEAQAALTLEDFHRVLAAARQGMEKGKQLESSILVAEAQLLRGRALTYLGKTSEAKEAFDEARQIFETTGDEGKLAEVLFHYAFVLQEERNPTAAEELLREALELHEKTGSRKRIAHVQNSLAFMVQAKGELAVAEQLLEEALATARDLGLRHREAQYLDTLVWVLFQQGRLERADRLGRELVALCLEIGDRRAEAWGRLSLGQIALAAGRLPESEDMHEKVLSISRELGNTHLTAFVLNGLGAVAFATGQLEESLTYFEASWERLLESGDLGEQAVTEPYHARALTELGELEEAVEVGRRSADRFRRAERDDFVAASLDPVVRGLWLQKRPNAARQTLEEALELGADSEIPDVRLRLATSEALLAADENLDDSLRRLRAIMAEAGRLGLRGLELETSLELGRMEAFHADAPENLRYLGRKRLARAAEEARQLGYGLIARRAAELIEPTAKTSPTVEAAIEPARASPSRESHASTGGLPSFPSPKFPSPNASGS